MVGWCTKWRVEVYSVNFRWGNLFCKIIHRHLALCDCVRGHGEACQRWSKGTQHSGQVGSLPRLRPGGRNWIWTGGGKAYEYIGWVKSEVASTQSQCSLTFGLGGWHGGANCDQLSTTYTAVYVGLHTHTHTSCDDRLMPYMHEQGSHFECTWAFFHAWIKYAGFLPNQIAKSSLNIQYKMMCR